MKRSASLVPPSVLAACIALAIAGSTATANSAERSSALPTISVAMDGKSIQVGGALQSGAVDVHSTVTKEPYGSPSFVRLNPGVTYAQFFRALQTGAVGQDPNTVLPFGTIVFDAAAPRGTSDTQTQLEPGDYVALDTATGKPPFPITTFTIAQASSPATLPAPKLTETAIDFGFRGPKVLRDGDLVRARNDGWVAHMAEAFGVRDAAAGRKAIALLRAGKDKRAQRLATKAFFSLLEPVSHGAVQQTVLRAKPGYYVEACYMDSQDGREHTQLGMERLIRVVR
jgi:uncharacterized protein YdbL (DUF1318 family)